MSFLTRFSQIIDPRSINIPKGNADDSVMQAGLQIIFGIAAAVALLIIAISAFRLIIARGNSQDISKARDAIIYASIGLVICMAAFTIVTFVVEGL